jgi:hypothetical protein
MQVVKNLLTESRKTFATFVVGGALLGEVNAAELSLKDATLPEKTRVSNEIKDLTSFSNALLRLDAVYNQLPRNYRNGNLSLSNYQLYRNILEIPLNNDDKDEASKVVKKLIPHLIEDVNVYAEKVIQFGAIAQILPFEKKHIENRYGINSSELKILLHRIDIAIGSGNMDWAIKDYQALQEAKIKYNICAVTVVGLGLTSVFSLLTTIPVMKRDKIAQRVKSVIEDSTAKLEEKEYLGNLLSNTHSLFGTLRQGLNALSFLAVDRDDVNAKKLYYNYSICLGVASMSLACISVATGILASNVAISVLGFAVCLGGYLGKFTSYDALQKRGNRTIMEYIKSRRSF